MYESIYEHPIAKGTPLPFSLPDWIALAPFEEYLGMRIEEANDGRAVLTMPFRAALCQGAGLMHGGAVVSLADTALAMAIKSLLPRGTHFATIEMTLKFHAPVRWGTVRAIAEVGERNDRDIAGQVEVVTEEGIKAATFRAIFRVKQEKLKTP
jgi:acyl-CoA thioesterase